MFKKPQWQKCGPRSDCSGSTRFASLLNLSVMLGNFLQQTTSADDLFRCIFFLGPLRVKEQPTGFVKYTLHIYSISKHVDPDKPQNIEHKIVKIFLSNGLNVRFCAQKSCLIEMVLLSILIICFG